jgi:hypothetical protein
LNTRFQGPSPSDGEGPCSIGQQKIHPTRTGTPGKGGQIE